jgi:hypothetical protein
MDLYLVFKQGVYRHECGGAFSSMDNAIAAAKKLIAGEHDEYHDYEIVRFKLDAITNQEPVVEENFGFGGSYKTGGDLNEDLPLASFKRQGEKIVCCFFNGDKDSVLPPIAA